MEIRYYISGIGYDENDCVTDYEKDFGDYDTCDEAEKEFEKLKQKDKREFFNDNSIYQLCVQLEECEETDDEINCIDVKDEFWITNSLNEPIQLVSWIN